MHAGQRGSFRPAYIMAMAGLVGLLGGCGHSVRKLPAPSPVPAAVDIGIPACNAYLNRYLACHRAARIFPGDSLQTHYQAMLASLRQGASDPQVHPYLAARCIGMSQQLDTTLQGRACASPPASPTPARPQR